MNRLNTDARLPQGGDPGPLLRRLAELQRENAALINALAEGRLAGAVNATTAAPTSGSYAPGDFVRNSAPSEAGTAGSRYVLTGWLCLTASPRLTVPDGSGRSPSLIYQTPQEFSQLDANPVPRNYTIADGVIQVEGGQPATFALSYYKRFLPLVGDQDTNWLLQNAPQVYLYSALIEAYQHVRDDVHAISAARQYAAAVNALIYADQQERFSGSTLTIGASR